MTSEDRSSPSRGRTALLVRLVLACFPVVVLVGLAELSVRLLAPGAGDAFDFQTVADIGSDHAARYRSHSERFYELRPDYAHSDEHLGRYAVGAWPFRGPVPESRPDGALRVVVLGDSCVYGAALDAADTLPQQTARQLAARGLGPDAVQVLNMGVPGYSTVQIELLLQEVLGTLEPDLVVVYPASWNDQVPALGANDLELLETLRNPPWTEWLRRRSRLLALALESFGGDAIGNQEKRAALEGWTEGDPPFGFRVPRAATEERLRTLVARCRAAGVDLVFVSPAHPPATAARYPRTREDAATVLRVAEELEVPVVPGQAVMESTGEPLERYFSDYAHPSPEGARLLARALAERVAPLLRAREAAPGTGEPSAAERLRILGIEPDRGVTFGDVTLEITLEGWDGERLPAVSVGGAPLLAVARTGPATIAGRQGANAAGDHDVVVVDRGRMAVLRSGYHVDAPRLVWQPAREGQAARLVLLARPGDRGRVFFAEELREQPEWSHRGAFWLPEGPLGELPETLVAGDDGTAAYEFPPGLAAPGRTYQLQGLVLPAGDPERMADVGRWTPVCSARWQD